jgi:hypothetical protein
MGDRYPSRGWAHHGMYLMAKPSSSTRVLTRDSGTLFPSSLRTSASGLLMPSVGAATSPPARSSRPPKGTPVPGAAGSLGPSRRRDARGEGWTRGGRGGGRGVWLGLTIRATSWRVAFVARTRGKRVRQARYCQCCYFCNFPSYIIAVQL